MKDLAQRTTDELKAALKRFTHPDHRRMRLAIKAELQRREEVKIVLPEVTETRTEATDEPDPT